MSIEITVVGKVEPGSVLHVRDVSLDDDMAQALKEAVTDVAGHKDFVLLVTHGFAEVEVLNEEKMAEHGWVRR